MVLLAESVTSRLGVPNATVERGTIEGDGGTFEERWNWPCGCAGEIIGGLLIELNCCRLHE